MESFQCKNCGKTVMYQFQREPHVVMCHCGYKHMVRTVTSVQGMPVGYSDEEFVHGDEDGYQLVRVDNKYRIKRDWEYVLMIDNLSDWPEEDLISIAKDVVDHLNNRG